MWGGVNCVQYPVSCLLCARLQVLVEVYAVRHTVSCVSHRPNVYLLCVVLPCNVTLSNPRDPCSDPHSGFMWLFRRVWRQYPSHLASSGGAENISKLAFLGLKSRQRALSGVF